MSSKNKNTKLILKVNLLFLAMLPFTAFAINDDPLSKMGTTIYSSMFQGVGISLCAVIIGVTFLLAKVGKVAWDQFMWVGLCAAGFIGTPSLIKLIQTTVGV